MRRIKLSRGFKQFIGGVILGGILMGIVALFSAHMVEATSDAEFCGSCHEMDLFCETWEEGAHGPAHKGIVAAKCTDCHLPHEGIVKYLAIKGKTGAHDTIAHILKKETDWLANREHREKFTYESGCRKCHVELEVPGISIKGFKAHRDYTLGETKETCISCHFDTGHKDLEERLTDKKLSANSTACSVGRPRPKSGGHSPQYTSSRSLKLAGLAETANATLTINNKTNK